MNAIAAPVEQFTVTDNGVGSGNDSDTNSDDSSEYYQPISTVDRGEDNADTSDDGGDADLQLPNGYAPVYGVENGVSSLDLSDDEYEEDDEEEEEERMREAAVERALREDEMRRNAPLTAENAGRVMEAMRGISFGGSPPVWAGRVPEDQWIHQIRTRLRRPPASCAADSTALSES